MTNAVSDISAFDHVLLTRVAVRLDDHRPPPSEAWLRERADLFSRLALPSVLAQRTASFAWLLFLDQTVPQWLLDDLSRQLPDHAELVVIDQAWSAAVVATEVAQRTHRPWLITSRLDSDDALAQDFMFTVQRHFTRQERAFLNPLKGAQFSPSGVATFAHPSNAFISLVERRGPAAPLTVFVDTHDRVHHHGPVEQIYGSGPLWLQGIHAANLVNGESGWPVRASAVAPRFPTVDLRPDVASAGLVTARLRAVSALALRFAQKPSRARFLPGLVQAAVRRRIGRA